MPQLSDVQTTFTKGELDLRLLGRQDVAAYRNGADKLRNVMVIPQGGATRRPGTVYIDSIPPILSESTISGLTWSLPNGGTVGNLYDDDVTTLSTTTTNISTTDDYVAWELDMGSDTAVQFIDVLQVSMSASSLTEEWAIEGKTAAGSYEVIGNTIRLIDTTARDFRRTPTKSYRYFRLVRNGTTDVSTAKISTGEVKVYTDAGTLSEVREFGFIFADDQRYLMLLTDYNLRVYRNTGGAETFQTDVPLPYPSADVSDVGYAIDNDTMVLFHDEYQTRKVIRSGDHDEWQPSKVTFTNIPQYDFGSGNEDIWSTTRGWPRCGVFFQARLWMGGSTRRPSTMIASVTSSPYDLDDSTTADDKAIHLTLSPSGEEVPTIRHIVVGPHLTLFTSSGEYYDPKTLDTGITPTNAFFRLSSRAGMDSQALVPHSIDGSVYFVQREGRSVREYTYNEVEQNYQAPPISLLSSHLIRSPVELAFRRQLSTNDTNLLLFVNDDGTIAAFTLLREQEIAAFTLWVTALTDKWVSVAAVKDDLYGVAQRVVDGTTYRFLERFDFEVLMDSALEGAGANNATLAWLPSTTVAFYLDGAPDPPAATNGSGAVNFSRTSNVWQVGLPWPDVKAEEDAYQATRAVPPTVVPTDTLADGETQVWVKLLPPPAQLPGGMMHSRRRRSPEVIVDLFETQHCKINSDEVSFKFSASFADVPLLYTGKKRTTGQLGWSRDGTPEIRQTKHQQFTLSAVTTHITTD